MSIDNVSLPRLRAGLKEAVQTLRTVISEQNALHLILARQPLDLPKGISSTPLPREGLPKFALPTQYPLGQHWRGFRLNSSDYPLLVCVAEGEADIRIGFPHTSKNQRGNRVYEQIKPRDCCVLQLPAPSILLLPPGTAYASGDQPPWERPHPELARSQVMWSFFLSFEVICHLHQMKNGASESQLSLQIKDTELTDLWKMLAEELALASTDNESCARALLYVLFTRLCRGLGRPFTKVADGINLWLPSHDISPSKAQVRPTQPLGAACEFVQARLHEELNPAIIAQHAQMSVTQLNRCFRDEFQLSTMQYVAQQRLEAAKIYLARHELSVAEVGRLFGYKNPTHFSRAFGKYVKISPSEYRHRHHNSKITSK